MVKRGPHGRPQASESEAQHGPFARLDASVKDTSVCTVDETGKIVRDVKVTSEPDALLAVLKNPAYRFKRIGLEGTAVAVAVQCAGRRQLAGGLCRDAAYAGSVEDTDQQDGPQ